MQKKKSLPEKIIAERKEEKRHDMAVSFLSKRVKLAKEAKKNMEAEANKEAERESV